MDTIFEWSESASIWIAATASKDGINRHWTIVEFFETISNVWPFIRHRVTSASRLTPWIVRIPSPSVGIPCSSIPLRSDIPINSILGETIVRITVLLVWSATLIWSASPRASMASREHWIQVWVCEATEQFRVPKLNPETKTRGFNPKLTPSISSIWVSNCSEEGEMVEMYGS